MGISTFPGIGPQNSDIAAAVAAPSAAAIASAVAAPSSATIASAVAAAVPTLAQINTSVTNNGNAYNGPSAATIASTTAASVPTLAQINSSVSTNSSPFGGTWTTISSGATTGTGTTLTFSGLGGYKFLRIYVSPTYTTSSQGEFAIRFNGDTGNNYDSYTTWSWGYGTTPRLGGYASSNGSNIGLTAGGPPLESPSSSNMFVIDVANATSTTGLKTVWFRGGTTVAATYGGGNTSWNGWGTWNNSSSAITSLSIVTFNASFTGTSTVVRILGAN